MTLRIIALLFVFGHSVAAQMPACKPLEADRILAKDLAAVVPAFDRVPPETLMANTPQPGSQRIFHHAELLSLAQRYSLPIDADASACFERAMEPLDRNRVLDAMRAALQITDAHIELSETSLYLVPRGNIEFGLARLGTPASPDQRAPVLWRGDVIYGDDHRFAIWARVRIIARRNHIVAAENLKTSHPIERSQLHEVTEEGFPTPLKPALSMDQLVGMMPLRPIAAGSVMRPEMISYPNDVNRGDLIEIEVRSGAARLVLTARAESGGRDGETIPVRNLESNKVFSAQVAGKGRAVVLADSVKSE
jgi:flagella basal body P-ring formation protein FlgA